MPAPGPGAYDHPHFDDADAADAYWEDKGNAFSRLTDDTFSK